MRIQEAGSGVTATCIGSENVPEPIKSVSGSNSGLFGSHAEQVVVNVDSPGKGDAGIGRVEIELTRSRHIRLVPG